MSCAPFLGALWLSLVKCDRPNIFGAVSEMHIFVLRLLDKTQCDCLSNMCHARCECAFVLQCSFALKKHRPNTVVGLVDIPQVLDISLNSIGLALIMCCCWHIPLLGCLWQCSAPHGSVLLSACSGSVQVKCLSIANAGPVSAAGELAGAFDLSTWKTGHHWSFPN